MKTIFGILINSVIILLATLLFPKGIQSDSFFTTILAAAIVAGCNLIAFKSVGGLVLVAIPLLFSAVFGVFGVIFMFFCLETLFLYIADWILNGFTIAGFWWGMLVILFLGVVNMLFNPIKK